MKEIPINSPYITLGKFLKIAQLISSGGEAKVFLLHNQVEVNRELEDRRGRKIYEDDVVEVVGVGEFVIKSD